MKLSSLPEFDRGYITCALWLFDERPGSGDYAQSGRPEALFANLAPAALASMQEDCGKFKDPLRGLLDLACQSPGYDASRAGHDFWLTRNGHGAGFWDRDELAEDVREKLSLAARRTGERDLYLGDDGLIYVFPG